VNINNGERFETYAIKGEKNSAKSPLMVLQQGSTKDDIIIIISYATLEFEEAKPSNLGLFFQMKRQFFNIIKISSK
jgi:aspartate 1-decarboxylase